MSDECEGCDELRNQVGEHKWAIENLKDAIKELEKRLQDAEYWIERRESHESEQREYD